MGKIKEVLDIINENKVFYVATVDAGQARVRPFGIMLHYNDKLCICTNDQKDVYRQIEINPNIEICSLNKDGSFLRLTGDISFDRTQEAKDAFISAMPQLAEIYANNMDSLVVGSFTKVTATFQTTQGSKEVTELY
jgi:uncharacterized pyridoxamine 5'-phosphate oxidase family protein